MKTWAGSLTNIDQEFGRIPEVRDWDGAVLLPFLSMGREEKIERIGRLKLKKVGEEGR